MSKTFFIGQSFTLGTFTGPAIRPGWSRTMVQLTMGKEYVQRTPQDMRAELLEALAALDRELAPGPTADPNEA